MLRFHAVTFFKRYLFLPALQLKLDLQITKNIQGLEFEYEIIETPEHELAFSYEKRIQTKAVKTIKKFSHFKHENVLRPEVESITSNESFANGLPTSFHEIVDKGIKKYYISKKSMKSTCSETSSDAESKE